MPKSVVIFLPEAGITPYLKMMCASAQALESRGYRVFLFECGGALPRCPFLVCCNQPYSIDSADKRVFCSKCSENVQRASSYYGCEVISSASFCSNFVHDADVYVETASCALEKLEYKGLAVGKIAIHDLMLETKVLSVENITDDHFELYKKYVKSVIVSYEVMNSICKKISPSLVLCFNPYAQNHGVRKACISNGVDFRCVTNAHHLGANWSLLQISDSWFIKDFVEFIQTWDSGKDIPLSARAVERCFDDIIFRMYESGSHIFSPPKSANIEHLFDSLDLDRNKKIFGVFTSSYDEKFGINILLKAWGEYFETQKVFPDQVSWLKYLCAFSMARDDVQFVVRIHPRECRNGIVSEHLKILRNEFSERYKNFIVIWPEDKISSYDLFEIIDGCLIANSTIGLECARMGIPLLLYEQNWTYPNKNFALNATSIGDYKIKLDQLISCDPTTEDMISALRFYNWRVFMFSLDISDDVSSNEDNPFQKLTSTRELVTKALLREICYLDYNLTQLKSVDSSYNEELSAIQSGIARIFSVIFSPKPHFFKRFIRKVFKKISRVFHVESSIAHKPQGATRHKLLVAIGRDGIESLITKTKKDKSLRAVAIDGYYCHYVSNGNVSVRMSKMLVRLAKMYRDCEHMKKIE